MRKRMICALLTVISMISVSFGNVAAQVFEGYPEHPDTNPPIKEQDYSVMNCWTESNPEYTFTVGGKTFVLLDVDEAGNYYVLAEEEYGKHPYSTAYTNGTIIETCTAAGGEAVFTPGDAHNMVFDNWKYDTENTASIGYWLNHDFLENGNGGNFKLPEGIKAYLVEKEWQIEGYKPVLSWTATQNYENVNHVQHAQEFAVNQQQTGYTVNGKIGLMSYTEYMYYQSVIGWRYCAAGWDGFMLRTPHALIVATDATKLKYNYGSVQVKNQSTAVDTSKKMIIACNDSPNSSNFYVRPSMWLSKDFFASVAVDLSSAGAKVKEEIAKNSYAKLSNIYSDADLELLGFDTAHAPRAEKCSVAGTPTEGAVLYAKYDFISPTDSVELDSEIVWYISDTSDGEYIPLGISGANVKADSTMIEKYLKYRVEPRDNSKNSGKYYWSEPVAVKAEKLPVVSGISIQETNVTLTLTNPSAGEKEIKVIKAVFDADNQLTASDGTSITLKGGTESAQTIDISEKTGGKKVSVMVWIENSQPIFYLNL